jgi:hypothetical protein
MCDYVRELRNLMELGMELRINRAICGVNYGNSKTAERGLALPAPASVVLGAGYA